MKFILFCFLLSIITSTSILANQEASEKTSPNGCGTGWNRYFVPDSIPIVQCSFEVACDEHDICYGKCENSITGDCEYRRCREGGDLYKNTKCKTDENILHSGVKAGLRRLQCDTEFYQKLRTINKGKFVCEAFAIVYRDAVKNWGEGAWNGIARFEGPTQDQDEYEKAIRDLFSKGTEEQFKGIVDADITGSKSINLKRPIKYDSIKGLVNIGP